MIINKAVTVNNNEIHLHEIGSKEGKAIFIIGVVHGEEPQGKTIIEKYLSQKISCKNHLFFIPCLNPDGMKVEKRQNANGVDLNRNFPTKNWGEDCKRENASEYFGGISPASEVETKFVINAVEKYKPEVILTIHAPYKVVNYDGPAKEIAEKISAIIGYPVTSDIGYPTPGSFGNFAGVERNIPTITLELDEEISTEELSQPVIRIFDYLANF